MEPESEIEVSDRIPGATAPRNLERLAAEVERLNRRLDDLSSAVDSVSNSRPAISDLADAFEELSQQVGVLTEQLMGEDEGPPRLPLTAWLDATAEQAPIILTELSEWIGTVLVQYDLDGGIVPCWYRHPDVVQVLLDLRLAWLTTYRNPEGKVLGALDWHQRYLPAARQYLKGLKMKCSDRDHTMRKTSFVVDPGALETYALWWGSGHELESEPDWVPPARQGR